MSDKHKDKETDKDAEIINTKEELVSTVKKWIVVENELTKLKKEVREKNKIKKKLSENVISVMKQKNIDCFDIKGGSLTHKQKKTKKPITGKFLLSQLKEYYKDNDDLAQEITQKVLDNRVEVIKDHIEIVKHET